MSAWRVKNADILIGRDLRWHAGSLGGRGRFAGKPHK